jgi:hypothetical protein
MNYFPIRCNKPITHPIVTETQGKPALKVVVAYQTNNAGVTFVRGKSERSARQTAKVNGLI